MRMAKSLDANARAASWTSTNSTSSLTSASANFTLAVRVAPPVTTFTELPKSFLNVFSKPAGAAIIISEAIGERFVTACSIKVRPTNWTRALGKLAPNRSPLPAAGIMRAVLGSEDLIEQHASFFFICALGKCEFGNQNLLRL